VKDMMCNYLNGYGNTFLPGMVAGWLSFLLIPITVWSLFWMGWALWRAARDGSKIWFIVLLLVHTMGILDIIYIFIISKKSEKRAKK
jgi:methionyl-tRNA synthetase